MAAQIAGGAPVERPAPPANDRDAWAYEVGQLLTYALARDDARGAHRCPLCGRRRFDTDLS